MEKSELNKFNNIHKSTINKTASKSFLFESRLNHKGDIKVQSEQITGANHPKFIMQASKKMRNNRR